MSNNRFNHNSVISFFANQIVLRIVTHCIKEFQKWKITLSGPDSGLKNTWDEICVQIQGEYSFHWDTYEDAVDNYLIAEVGKLNDFEKFAIWLQSDQGVFYEQVEDENPVISEDDILDFLKDKIYQKAGSWSNKRIRKYLTNK